VTESLARTDSAKNEPLLLRQDRDGIATLTLNRPQARNALSMALMGELLTALAALAQDPAVKVVILAAADPASAPAMT
jgi:Enoyl-CoA hydratase/carnithine racemase